MSVMSLHPSTLNWIVNDIRVNGRRTILELGAGISTQLIAQCLKACYGDEPSPPRFFSVEDNEGWIDYLRATLAKDGLDRFVQFVHAPRIDYGSGTSWFDKEVLDAQLDGIRPDLLVVDGPCALAAGQQGDRMEAFNYFGPRMADNYTLFIDDVFRPSEQRLYREWARQEKVKSKILNGYLGVIIRGTHYVSQPF